MAKYKYIGNSRPNRENNKIYDGESKANAWCYSVSELAIKFPYEWQLIQEKSPEELLIEEAKIRYPILTEFYSALPEGNPTKCICYGGYIFEDKVCEYRNIIWAYDHTNEKLGWLYCDGVWAETVKEEPMCAEKTIKLSLDQAKKMYGKSPEMDELLLANFSKEELTKKELPKSWDKIGKISGYYLEYSDLFGRVRRASFEIDTKTQKYYHRFATEKQAKSALAMAQLSQLMAVYNDGWEPIWNYTNNRSNWCIVRSGDELRWQNVGSTYSFLAFESLELCELFLKNFEPLIKEYFMID